MTATASAVYPEVEIRSWPERADLVVIDVQGASVLAHYPLTDPRPYTIWDPTAAYDDRAAQAIEFLEDEQEYLQACFMAKDQPVCLKHNIQARERIDALLRIYGLSLEQVELGNIRSALAHLNALDLGQVYGLLAEWYDIVERHYPAGSAAAQPPAWMVRSAPHVSSHFHYLAAEVEQRSQATPEQADAAYELFQMLIDVPLQEFTFGLALRYIYYLRTEFVNHQPFELRALAEAGV